MILLSILEKILTNSKIEASLKKLGYFKRPQQTFFVEHGYTLFFAESGENNLDGIEIIDDYGGYVRLTMFQVQNLINRINQKNNQINNKNRI